MVDSLAFGAVTLMHRIDAQKAGLAVGRRLFALVDGDCRGARLFKMAQAVARAAAQVVEVAVGETGQPLELSLAVDLELALEDVARGRGPQRMVLVRWGGSPDRSSSREPHRR